MAWAENSEKSHPPPPVPPAVRTEPRRRLGIPSLSLPPPHPTTAGGAFAALTDIWDANLTGSGYSFAGSIANKYSPGSSKALSEGPPVDKSNSANLARS